MNKEEIRTQLDDIDHALLDLLSKRMQLSKEMGELKKKENVPIEDSKREQHLIAALKEKHPDINPLLIDQLYFAILQESKELQKNVK